MACLVALFIISTAVAAPGDVINCTTPVNMSNSEGHTSADPFLLNDPAGLVHLFWAEQKAEGHAGTPDTIMYAVWNGETWSRPNDILMSAPDMDLQRVNAIRGVLDTQGRIHLIWIGPDNQLLYSSALADEAGSAQAWQPQLLLDDDQNGVQYSADIAFEPPQTLHVVYGRAQKDAQQTLVYISSTDGGLTWSDPFELFTFANPEHGSSNIRLLVDGPGKLYLTWTEWDLSGNGQAIYFSRSLDSGLSWEEPVVLAKRAEGEYERDWTNLAVLGDNQLMALWEGGFRAYPQAQYSEDGGVTWSNPIDTFPWLIADNGFAEFARDSEGRLHVFLARRIREGYEDMCSSIPGCIGDGNAIWHSVWEGGRKWQEPKPLKYTFSTVNFITMAIAAGNQLVAAWFSYGGSAALEVNVMTCKIEDATAVTPQVRPLPAPTQAPTLTPAAAPSTATPTSTPAVQLTLNNRTPSARAASSGSLMFLYIAPAISVVILVVLVAGYRRNT